MGVLWSSRTWSDSTGEGIFFLMDIALIPETVPEVIIERELLFDPLES